MTGAGANQGVSAYDGRTTIRKLTADGSEIAIGYISSDGVIYKLRWGKANRSGVSTALAVSFAGRPMTSASWAISHRRVESIATASSKGERLVGSIPTVW